MLIDDFLEPNILIVSGKGGVGKTTVAAALALVAARHGRRVCVAAIDQKGALPRLFGEASLTYEPSEMSPGVWGMNVTPEAALAEYLDVQYHVRHISRVFSHTHFVDYVTTAAPGLKDILMLGKIWYLEQGRSNGGAHGDFDTILIDAPATGHMLSFLSAPIGFSDALKLGPLRRQSDWLIDMLRDRKRTRVHLVALAEEMPVAETRETSRALTERLRIDQGVIFANAIYPDLFSDQDERRLEEIATEEPDRLYEEAEAVGLKLDAEDVGALFDYARLLRARRAIQSGHLATLREDVAPPVVELPFLFSAGLALPDVERLSEVIEERVEKL